MEKFFNFIFLIAYPVLVMGGNTGWGALLQQDKTSASLIITGLSWYAFLYAYGKLNIGVAINRGVALSVFIAVCILASLLSLHWSMGTGVAATKLHFSNISLGLFMLGFGLTLMACAYRYSKKEALRAIGAFFIPSWLLGNYIYNTKTLHGETLEQHTSYMILSSLIVLFVIVYRLLGSSGLLSGSGNPLKSLWRAISKHPFYICLTLEVASLGLPCFGFVSDRPPLQWVAYASIGFFAFGVVQTLWRWFSKKSELTDIFGSARYATGKDLVEYGLLLDRKNPLSLALGHFPVRKRLGSSTSINRSETSRDLIMADELLRFPRAEQLLFKQGAPVIRCRKVNYLKESTYNRLHDPNPTY
jgi:hypothetical protein